MPPARPSACRKAPRSRRRNGRRRFSWRSIRRSASLCSRGSGSICRIGFLCISCGTSSAVSISSPRSARTAQAPTARARGRMRRWSMNVLRTRRLSCSFLAVGSVPRRRPRRARRGSLSWMRSARPSRRSHPRACRSASIAASARSSSRAVSSTRPRSPRP